MSTYIPYTVRTRVVYSGRGLSASSFENAVFVAHHNLFTERQKAYSSTDTMLEDGFAAGSPAVVWATGVFAGKQAPTNVYIGRAVPDTYSVRVLDTVDVDSVVSVNMKLDGVASTFSYTVTGDELDLEEVANALGALIEADAGITSATADALGVITIVPASLTTPLSFGVNTFTTIYTTTAETPSDIMVAVRAEGDDFAVVCAETHLKAEQAQYASYVNALPALYVYSTSDEDVTKSLTTDDIFSVLQGLQYQYVEGTYNENSDIEFPGCCYWFFLSSITCNQLYNEPSRFSRCNTFCVI